MALRLAVLVSGGGTTLQNLLERIGAGSLDAEVAVVIASNRHCFALTRAKDAGIPAYTVPVRTGPIESDSAQVFAWCRRYGVELVVLGGFLRLLRIPDDFVGRVINTHPALIPAFCGKGYYGQKVHRAAIERGVKVSGCTVHFADNEYDHGPIIVQRTVPVFDTDTPESLAERVFAEEKSAVPEAIALFAAGRLVIEGRRVRVVGPKGT